MEKRKLIIIIILLIMLIPVTKAQITIGSLDPPHSSAILELKSSDKGFLGPRVRLTNIWDTISVPNYTDGLLVLNTHDSSNTTRVGDQVRAGKYYYWSTDQWVELVVKKAMIENIEQTLSMKGIPRPAIFSLNGNKYIFSHDPVGGGNEKYDDMKGVINLLQGVYPNNSAYLPLTERLNYTSGAVTLDSTVISGDKKKFSIIFQPGIYSIIFTYEFVPSDTAESGQHLAGPDRCFSATYFMEFPVNILNTNGTITKDLTRIESNCYHGPGYYKYKEGRFCDHGNTICYVAVLLTETAWDVALGTGHGDDYCNAARGYSMPNRSRFF